MTATAQWYYANPRNEHQGPLTASALLEKRARGELTADTLVWREGMAEWQPLSAVMAQVEDDARASAPPQVPETAVAADASGDDNTASPYTAPASVLSLNDGAVLTGGEVVYAGFWRRVAANVIDGFIINLAGFLVLLLLAPVFGVGMVGLMGLSGGGVDEGALGAGMILFQLLAQLGVFALSITYYVWMQSSAHMATLGKMAVGIKVVRADGTRISVARGIGRYFAFMLSSLTMGIGFIMAGMTQRKQALHDMICDTLVVDKWAFTERPDLQQKGLGAVTIVVLVLFALFMVALFFAIIGLVAAGIAAS